MTIQHLVRVQNARTGVMYFQGCEGDDDGGNGIGRGKCDGIYDA